MSGAVELFVGYQEPKNPPARFERGKTGSALTSGRVIDSVVRQIHVAADPQPSGAPWNLVECFTLPPTQDRARDWTISRPIKHGSL